MENKDIQILVGLDYLYSTFIPYIQVEKKLSKTQTIHFMYENRFKSFGLKYDYKDFSIGIQTDRLKKSSVFGLKFYVNILDF